MGRWRCCNGWWARRGTSEGRAVATVGPHCPWRVMVPPPQVECSEIMLKAINLSWSAITFTIGLSINSPDHDGQTSH